MTLKSKPEDILYPLITEKEKKRLRVNFHRFLKKHKEPEFVFTINKKRG